MSNLNFEICMTEKHAEALKLLIGIGWSRLSVNSNKTAEEKKLFDYFSNFFNMSDNEQNKIIKTIERV